jgi:hypothetical protein
MTTLTTNIENDSSDGYDDTVPALVIDPNVSIVSDQIGVLTGVDAGGGAIEFDATAEIFNYGQIISFAGQGSYDAGVYVANGASLFNERSGSIEGYYGVYSPNDNGSVRNDGYIDGLEDGVRLAGGDASLINTGTITGTEYAVYDAFGGGLITNSGTIDGVLYAARADDVDNAGLWKGQSAVTVFDLVASGDVIANSHAGTIDGGIKLAAGADTITNAGSIDGAIAFTGAGITNSLTNSGEIAGNIKFSSAHSTLTNAGSVTGDVTMVGTDTLINTGVIHGDVTLGVSDIVELSVGEVTGAITGKTNDLFAFSGNFGNETIDKFIGGTGPTHDTIRFATNDFGSFATVKNHMSQVGADVVIRLDGTDSITLDRIKLSSLVAADFKFV